MQVLKAFPPNYDEICRHIPAVRKIPTIVFTYGDSIYNPGGHDLDAAFLAHENTHVGRQSDPPAWWDRYLSDVQFRLDEEIIAYRAQYQYAVKHYSRPERRRLLAHIANDLSGAMYGKLVNRQEAVRLITEVSE